MTAHDADNAPKKPPRPVDDEQRVRALHDLKILDTPRESRFDRLTRKIANAMEVPMAYVALVDRERQWIKSKVGDLKTEVERDQSFCTHTIEEDRPLVVPDATKDSRFEHNPFVTENPNIRFYAGVPITDPGGFKVGTVCIADDRPREISPAELSVLEGFATSVQQEINAKPSVFISYAHEDEAWKDRLVVHCSVMQRQGLLDVWNDRKIGTGQDWSEKIRDAVERAKVAVLLVSADFLASEFILSDEVPRLLERRDAEGLVVLPLLLKPCGWDQVGWLARMNLRPRDGKPIMAGKDFEIDAELAKFASEIGQTVRKLGRALEPSKKPPEQRRRATDKPTIDRRSPGTDAAAAGSVAAGPVAGGPGKVRVGSFLGSYEILDSLGSGSTGEVFLAQDSNLKRKVALKVLKRELSAEPLRLARFQREAEAAAALNHPNIVTLYSVEEDRGIRFFTMELVKGERLDRIIPQGGLQFDKFFDLALRLTDAVASAHRSGIVHRDLKAANVMVTDEGRLKVLDFGLAKLLDDEESVMMSGVRSVESLSEEGLVLGTVPYMSPEQVGGRSVDHRTDIFSLGVLMFEMLAGHRPFKGDSSADLVASILRDAPRNVAELRSDLPNHLGRIVQRCLEKNPEQRYQSAMDLLNELEGLRKEVMTGEFLVARTAAIPVPTSPDVRPKRIPMIAAGVLAAALLVIVGFWALDNVTGPREAGGGPPASAMDGAGLQDQNGEPSGSAQTSQTVAADSAVDPVPPPSETPPVPGDGPSSSAGPRPPESSKSGARESVPAREASMPQEPRDGTRQPVSAPPPPETAIPRDRPPAPTGASLAAGVPADEPSQPAEAPPTEPAESSPPPVTPSESPAPAVGSKPSPQEEEQRERDAIRGTLKAYAAAMSTLDAAAVERVQPDIDAEMLDERFSNMRSQEIDLMDCRLRLEDGATASASCRERVKVVLKRGISPKSVEHVIVFSLRKRGGSWIIVGRSTDGD